MVILFQNYLQKLKRSLSRSTEIKSFVLFENFFSLFLFFAMTIGCFPVKTLNPDSKDFAFSWFHPSAVYSIFITAFNTLSSTNFLIHDPPSYINASFRDNLATSISEYLQSMNFLVSDAIIRLTALIYCAKTIQLIKIIQNVKRNTDLMTMAISEQVPSKNMFRSSYNQRLCVLEEADEDKKYSSLKIYVLLGITIILHFINHISQITRIVAYDTLSAFHTPWKLKYEDQIFRTIWWLNQWFGITSFAFSFSLVVLLGVQLSSLFQTLKDLLLRSTLRCVKNGCLLDQPDFRSNITSGFRSLVKGYEIFLEVAGTYALIHVSSGTVALGQNLYQFSTSLDITRLSHTVACGLWVYNMAATGDDMHTKISNAKEEIRSSCFFGQIQAANDNFREIAEWVTGWKWTFTARNFFVLKRSLVLGSFETVMAYVIFLFQLRLSDAKK